MAKLIYIEGMTVENNRDCDKIRTTRAQTRTINDRISVQTCVLNTVQITIYNLYIERDDLYIECSRIVNAIILLKQQIRELQDIVSLFAHNSTQYANLPTGSSEATQWFYQAHFEK